MRKGRLVSPYGYCTERWGRNQVHEERDSRWVRAGTTTSRSAGIRGQKRQSTLRESGVCRGVLSRGLVGSGGLGGGGGEERDGRRLRQRARPSLRQLARETHRRLLSAKNGKFPVPHSVDVTRTPRDSDARTFVSVHDPTPALRRVPQCYRHLPAHPSLPLCFTFTPCDLKFP